MQPRVTALLVVRNGEKHLQRTLDAISAQSRRPDALLIVDAGSTDGSAALIAGADALISTRSPALPLGEAVSAGLRAAPPAESLDDWLWLLTATTAPEPDALAALLAAVEVAPSVALAGPKLVDPDDRSLILGFGESVSELGSTVPLVDREFDQAQHDTGDDVLGVALPGVLVRRVVWERLKGADPGLPTTDAGLDLSIRMRLSGHRVIRVPAARVSIAQRVEDFGRRRPSSKGTRRRLARSAQLHRRFAYAPAVALPFHWLALVPLALLRSIGHLVAKRPAAVGPEFAAAFIAAFADGQVFGARRRLAAERTAGWAAIAPLRISFAEVRERRSSAREREDETRADEAPIVRAEFFAGGGPWVVLIAAIVSVVMFWRLLGVPALEGGGLLPLAGSVPELWEHALSGWRELGVGFVAPADPFAFVLAVLGSITFWSPSLSIVALWLAAIPLAALGAWWCATRLSERAWPPAVAALLWAFAPPLLAALGDGRIGAVLAHLVLPWLVLAVIEGARSWSAAAVGAILFAVVVACSPSLAPALLVLWFAWLVAHPKRIHRLITVPIPAAVLFAPLALFELSRGTPLALLADPGVVVPLETAPGWQLALAAPQAGAGGWTDLAASLGVDPLLTHVLLAVLLAPLAVLALAAVFLPGAARALPALVVALLGFATAVAASHISLTSIGAVSVSLWPGAGLSLYWMGVIGAAIVAVDALGKVGGLAGGLVAVCATISVVPLVIAGFAGTTAVAAGDGRILPALVAAQAVNQPDVGTLVIEPLADGSVRATLQRGAGATLDDQSTVAATRMSLTSRESELAVLAGNLASRSGLDPTEGLQRFGIGFVVVTAPEADANPEQIAVRTRVREGLDATAALTAGGDTRAGATLWRYPEVDADATTTPPRGAAGTTALIVLAIVFGAALLLAVPTRRRRRVVPAGSLPGEDPADTFEEDSDG